MRCLGLSTEMNDEIESQVPMIMAFKQARSSPATKEADYAANGGKNGHVRRVRRLDH
jgi:hypothetical protein